MSATPSTPSQRMSLAASGTLIGALAGLALLVAAGVWLYTGEGATYKVLVAVWLWALPVIGVFSGLGYLLGKGADAVERGESERPR